MPDAPERKTGPLERCGDVYGLLDQIRLRPSVWVPGGSLHDLQNILIGYDAALVVNGLERSAFWPTGPFADWLHERYGWSMSTGWARAIEREAGAEEPLRAFLRLLDEYRTEGR
ncbi:hypothetical protein [Nocardiopsis potens]|uniref:hypothetical protein n=1 Tax=Nocardiopsis potens TaxID=1246458 RepID=UPI00034D84E6|nr:hypothetical protein [Nocardiopsis potens]